MRSEMCPADHHFYVADIATIEQEGAIAVTIVCTSCGEMRHQRFQITKKLEKGT